MCCAIATEIVQRSCSLLFTCQYRGKKHPMGRELLVNNCRLCNKKKKERTAKLYKPHIFQKLDQTWGNGSSAAYIDLEKCRGSQATGILSQHVKFNR